MVLLGLLALAGCSGGKHDQAGADQLLSSAKAHLASQDRKAAVIELKGALQQKPDLAEARYLLGATLLESGNPAAAAVELRKALDLHHTPLLVLPPLARALVASGEGNRLLDTYASTPLSDPLATADLKTSVAEAWGQRGDKARAEAALNEALKLAPEHAPARLLKARQQAAEGRSDTALALLAEVVQKDPANAQAWLLRGELLDASQPGASAAARDDAIAAYGKALSLQPDLVAAHVGLMKIHMARQDHAAVQAAFDTMKKALPEHRETTYFATILALQRQDLASARQLADKLMGAGPSNPNYMRLAGTVALQAGDLPKAEGLFSNALQVTPGNAVLRRLLVRTQLRSAQPALALATLQPLLAKGTADAETLVLAAMAHEQAGNAQQARALFAAAEKLKPADPRLRAALAYSHRSGGDAGAALGELRAVAAADPLGEADLAYISALMARGEFDKALTAVDALEKKLPGKPVTAQLRGRVALARGDVAAARSGFERAAAIDPKYFPAYSALAALDLREQHPAAAQKRFETLLQHDPKNARALVALAGLRQRDKADKAEVNRLLADAVAVDPGQASTRVLLVEQHLRNQDVKQALAAAQDGLAALPNNAALLDAMGRAQLAAGDHNQALTAFNQLVAQQPKSPQPHVRVAQVRIAMKDQPGAVQSLKRALALQPGYPPAVQGLIELALQGDKPADALAVARDLQKQQPNSATGFVTEGAVQARLKNWDGAASAYRAALKRQPASNTVAMSLHTALAAGGPSAEAEKFAAGWLKDHPRDGVFTLYLGEMALARQDYARAESKFQAVLKLDPKNAAAMNNLAWLLLAQHKPGALGYAEKANALVADQPAYLDTLAMALAEDKQLPKALVTQKRAVELQPDNPSIRLNLARLYLQSGDKPLAKAELDRLSALGDRFGGQSQVTELRKTL
jgi:putative PEP-CTERM system TPR-repeat lipoprotein